MSYPYDLNPWDDNYQQTPSTSQQTSHQADNSAAYIGYSNPMAQYEVGQDDNRQLYENPADTQMQPPTQSQPEQQPGKQSERSAISRFLRQRLPLYGALMDKLDPCLEIFFKHVDRQLLVSKMFYFFFYSAFGSLFPLMGVYFKQLGMNPAQVGILTGVRPFIEIFSAPFWHSLAERFRKSKALLVFSLLSWIVFTYSLAHIRPPASACIAFNDSDYVLYTPYSNNDLSNFEISQQDEGRSSSSESSGQTELPSTKTSPVEGKVENREGRDEVLASEENQNDQRRRKRRQAAGVEPREIRNHLRYLYDLNQSQAAELYQNHMDLDLDLESDFDDRLASQRAIGDDKQHTSFVETIEDLDDGMESDELEKMHQETHRTRLFKRSEREEEESSESETEDADEQVKGKSEKSAEEEVETEDQEEIGRKDHHDSASGPKSNSHQQLRQEYPNPDHQSRVEGNETPITDTPESSDTARLANKTKRVFKHRHKTPPTHIVGKSPITVEYAANYNKEKHGRFVTPMFSTIVYRLDDIKNVFFLLLLLISLGEFFSAPALTLADSATLSYLGDNTDQYGRQRMFGSLSWAVTLLLVGMALDNSTSIADHPCGPHIRERSYTVCYIIFSLLMACALITATQFKFNYASKSDQSEGMVSKTNKSASADTSSNSGGPATNNIDDFYASTQPRSIFNTAPPINAPPHDNSGHSKAKDKFEYLDKWKSAVFAQNTWEVPEWVNVFRQFKNSLHLMYLFITWFLGCGVGLVFTFLFWHLQDVGGTPTLFGICSVINHISEILAYFFSFNFIKRFGHTKVSNQDDSQKDEERV